MILEGKVGPRRLSDGAEGQIRFGRDSELVVGQAHGKYYESVLRGGVFAGATAAAGVAPGTAIGTTTPYTLANPAGSGKNLVVLRVTMGYVSGTLGAGLVVYAANINPVAAAVTGTAITVTNLLLGSRQAGVGLAFTTATVPANPTILRPFCILDAALATSVVGARQIVEDVDGEFVIAPGCALSLQGIAAAGTSPLVMFGMTWEEVSI